MYQMFSSQPQRPPNQLGTVTSVSEPLEKKYSSVCRCFFEITPLLQRASGDRLLPISPGGCAESQSSRRATRVAAEDAAQGARTVKLSQVYLGCLLNAVTFVSKNLQFFATFWKSFALMCFQWVL